VSFEGEDVSNDDFTPISGAIVFTERRQPPLQAGDYYITVTQALSNKTPPANGPAAPDYISENHATTRRFTVRGERFVLDPTEVLAVFPPNNNNGEYDNVLPHVVFNRRTLPWERSPELSADGASWLAILLFEEDEAPSLQSAQVGDLQRDAFPRSADDPAKGATSASPSTLSETTASYVDGFPEITPKNTLTFKLEQGEQIYDPCQVIDVPAALFAKIAPALADLKWLAHVRTVSSDKKAGGDPGDTQENSVVVGNRLPKPNGKCVAHLVSLEGLVAFLPAEDGTPASITVNNAPATAIRLISLASWSFTSVDPHETFSAYLEGLDVAALQRPDIVNGASATEIAVTNAFRLGYTALKHQTRIGDQTVSWLRGPLLPFVNIAETIVKPPATDGGGVISAADQAARYNPETGMLDVTYSAAWQIGRLIALQSSIFSVALYNWKRAAGQKTAKAVEHQNLATQFSTLLSLSTPTPTLAAMAKTPLPHGSLAASIMDLLAGGLMEGIPSSSGAKGAKPITAATPLTPRVNHFFAISAVISDHAMLADIQADTVVPSEVTAWLNDLVKLNGVPFGYLVPDEAMLPPESIRLFHIDNNWINALIEGACSIGRSSSADLHLDAVLVDKLYAAANPPKVVTGFLLRSAVVDGWPGLEVTAYDVDKKQLASVVRMDKLAPSLLLFMVEGAIAYMDIHEPAEGLHFGVDLATDQKEMRYITVPAGAKSDAKPGTLIDNSFASVTYRDDKADAKVVRIADLAASALAAVKLANANLQNNVPRNFTSAEFAVELVEGVQSVRFQAGAA
jgi:hypothetical protein